jgi:hypothetical protein
MARLSRPLHTVVLTWHITSAAGWFALVVAQLAEPREDLRRYLVGTAAVALVSGLVLALASQIGLFRYWWVVAKLAGSTLLAALGLASLAGWSIPWAPYVGLVALWGLIWLSVARPWRRTPHGVQMAKRRGKHRV